MYSRVKGTSTSPQSGVRQKRSSKSHSSKFSMDNPMRLDPRFMNQSQGSPKPLRPVATSAPPPPTTFPTPSPYLDNKNNLNRNDSSQFSGKSHLAKVRERVVSLG